MFSVFQNYISNFIFQFIKKMKWHFGYTDSKTLENMIFLYYFSNFNKKVGVDGWAALFYRKTLQVGFWKIRI